MFKKILYYFLGIVFMGILPTGFITDWNLKVLFTNSSAGFSAIGLIVLGIIFFLIRHKYKDEIKDLPNSHIAVYIYKQISGVMVFGFLSFALYAISSFTEQIWLIFGFYGVGYIIGTHFFYLAACTHKE